MVAPLRHVATLAGLSTRRSRRAHGARRRTPTVGGRTPRTSPTASTSGVNIGRAAGAGIPGHVHVHVLPALERRHQLHDRGRRGAGAARSRCSRATRSCEATGPTLGRCRSSRRTVTADEPTTSTATSATSSPRISTSPRTSGRTCSRHATAPHRRRRSTSSRGRAACSAGWRRDNGGLLAAAIFLALIAAYHFVAAWPLNVDQTEALLDRDRARSASRSGTRQRAARVARPAQRGRRGASCSTAPTSRRACAASSSSTRSTATCIGRVHRAEPRRLVEVRARRDRLTRPACDLHRMRFRSQGERTSSGDGNPDCRPRHPRDHRPVDVHRAEALGATPDQEHLVAFRG